MNEATARKHLGAILRSLTGGIVLHLLADVFRQMADKARLDGDETAAMQCQDVAAALFVVGLGIDAACPRE